VSEKLQYCVGDNFKENVNYISFDNISSVPDIIQNLLSNPEKISEMIKNNYDYHNNYLNPDQLVLKTLHKANLLAINYDC
jgi:hypothetical protein